jgi:hypothetical protein
VHRISYRRVSIRAIEAAERRQTREAHKRLRELERQAKEQEKLSQLEQARLEVETFENRLEILLSVHKEQGEPWNWSAIAATLAPPCPQKHSHHELRAELRMSMDLKSKKKQNWEAELQQARTQDEQDFQKAMESYTSDKDEWETLQSLSRRILSLDYKAFADALSEFSPLSEISELGSAVNFTSHSVRLLECSLKVNGVNTIPNEVKTLTSTGKLSIKPMPKAKFHEVYQDYVCGCVLRVAREVFAFLPVDTLLITSLADLFDPSTGQTVERPVLSVEIPRTVVAKLNFDRLDPSDAMENFVHRGDFKATRNSGAFQPIIPLTPAEIAPEPVENMSLDDLLANVRRIRAELQEELLGLCPKTIGSAS